MLLKFSNFSRAKNQITVTLNLNFDFRLYLLDFIFETQYNHFVMDIQRILKKEEESLVSLSSLWDELGLDAATRRAHVEELYRKVEEIFDDKLKQERNVRDQCVLNIERCRTKISQISKQLGQDENQYSSLNQPLLQELGRLNEMLEGLEGVRIILNNNEIIYDLSRVLVLIYCYLD